MKRVLFFVLVVLASASAGAMVLNGVEQRVDTLYHYQVGPGTWYTQVRARSAADNSNRLDIYILQIDRRNPYVSMHTVLACDSILTGERPSNMARRKSGEGHVYFAGTNGDWWSTSRPGVPEGAFVTENTLAITPMDGRAPLAMCAIDQNDSLYFGHDFFTDVVITRGTDSLRCNHVNDTRYSGELVLYNIYNGHSTRTDNSGTELLCRIADGAAWGTNTRMPVVVEQVRAGAGNTPIDEQHVVLSASGDPASFLAQYGVGDTIPVIISSSINGVYADFKAALGGQDRPFMLYDGVVNETWAERHPRTGLGFSQTGDTIIQCVVDGRGLSVGCTCGTLAQIMKHFGAWWAMNMEGGGSSSMNILKVGVMNAPSDGSERAESQGLFAVSSAPEDETIARIAAYEQVLRMPLYGQYTPKVLGYNQYDALIETDVEGVTLSCDPAVGYVIDGNRFICLGSGVLHLSKGDAAGEVLVRIDTVATPAFRLDSVLISQYKGYSVESQVTYSNKVLTLLPSALEWSAEDPSVATVSDDGYITAVAEGTTRVIGSLGDMSDTLLVRVEMPEADPLRWSDMHECTTDWTMKASSSSWNTSVVQLSDTLSGLYVKYSTARQANIKFTVNKPLFSTPDTFCIRLTPNGFPVQRMIVRLRANSMADALAVTDTISDTRAPICLKVALQELFDAAGDMAIYPVVLESLVFYLDTSAPAGEYTMGLDGIYLHYAPRVPLSLESAKATDARLIWQDGQLLISRSGRLYDLTGRLLR